MNGSTWRLMALALLTVVVGLFALTPGGPWWSQAAQVLLAMMLAFMLGVAAASRALHV